MASSAAFWPRDHSTKVFPVILKKLLFILNYCLLSLLLISPSFLGSVSMAWGTAHGLRTGAGNRLEYSIHFQVEYSGEKKSMRYNSKEMECRIQEMYIGIDYFSSFYLKITYVFATNGGIFI